MGDKGTDAISVKIGWMPMIYAASLLAVLKLTVFPGMSWWLVTAPLWFFPAVFSAFMAMILVMIAVVSLLVIPVALYQHYAGRK